MGHLVLILGLAGTGLLSLAYPWIGVAFSYLIILLDPQNIWWWAFEEVRPVYWILVPTMLGLGFAIIRGKISITILNNKRSLYLFILWGSLILSYYTGPYVDVAGPYRFHDPAYIYSLVNKIFLLYFIGCMCIDKENRLQSLWYVMVLSVAYLIYWTNGQYFFEYQYGRIGGPAGLYNTGVYKDENAFAMLFVTGLPFIFYLGVYSERAIVRWTLWLLVPFGWHAIFLTGSRGGLVGLLVTLALIAYRSPKPIFRYLLIPAFAVAFYWQAGDVMKNRAETIDDFRTERSASTRLEAWSAAINMARSHPFTGVGLASFGPAFPHYSNYEPRVAHNTFLQILAESGVLAGMMYVMVVVTCIKELWRNGKWLKNTGEARNRLLHLMNEATLIAFVGLTVCSLFLSLQVYEIFYFLCLLVNAIIFLSAKVREQTAGEVADSSAMPPESSKQ